MGLKVAVQMDPIERISIAADSTFRIMEEAQARGHRLFYYTPDRLALDDGRVTARGCPVEVRREAPGVALDRFKDACLAAAPRPEPSPVRPV